MQEITNKKFFRNYAFFLLVLAVIFAILIYMSLISRKYWTNNLAKSVQSVLNEYEEGMWSVQDNIDIEKPIGVISAAYTIKNQKTNSIATAIIIRVTTFYGPLPAVFIYTDTEEVIFAGWASLHGRVKIESTDNKSDKRLEYWQKKIPEILR